MEKTLKKASKEFDRMMTINSNQEAAKARAEENINKLLNQARAEGASEQDILRALHPTKGDEVIIRSPGYDYDGLEGKLIAVSGDFGTIKTKKGEFELYLSCFAKA